VHEELLLQVVNEFKAFRVEAAKHGAQFVNNPGQFWGMIMGQAHAGVEDNDDAACKFENMFKLHLLFVLIPTSQQMLRGLSATTSRFWV
jgi:hypothetical protein